MKYNPLELRYTGKPCKTAFPLSADDFDLAHRMVASAKEIEKRTKVNVLAANQFGFEPNIIVFRFDDAPHRWTPEKWYMAADMVVSSTEGEAQKMTVPSLSFPNEYVQVSVFPKAEFMFYDVETGNSVTSVDDQNRGALLQAIVLFAENKFNRVPRDYNTIKETAPKLSRNAACPCGSGLKFKKCCIGSFQQTVE